MAKVSFDERYKKEECYWGLRPKETVIPLLKYEQSGSVLDIGVGEGRNALFLAKKGFDVTGVDISESGIEKFMQLAKKFKVRVKGIVSDITKFKFGQSFDIMISIDTLHFLSKKDITKIVKRMKKHTSEKGINLIEVFTVMDEHFKKHPKKLYYFQKNELRNYYRDWKVLEYKEFLTKPEKHGNDGKIHQHSIAVLIARKL